MKQGLKKRGNEQGKGSLMKEIENLFVQDVFGEVDYNKLSPQNKKCALLLLMFIIKKWLEVYHTIVVKCLWMCLWSQTDLQTSKGFHCTRVCALDKHNWKKLPHLMIVDCSFRKHTFFWSFSNLSFFFMVFFCFVVIYRSACGHFYWILVLLP